MEDVEEGPGSDGGRNRRRRRLEDHISRAIAMAGSIGELQDAIVSAITKAFGDIMLNLTLNKMIDGNMVNKSMNKYQLKKVSVFT